MLYKSTLGGYMDKKLILMRIEQLMMEKGITKYQLRENAEISSTIYQWKKNATRDKFRVPSLRSIEKICDYLDVSLSYFFAFDNETQRSIKNEELIEAIQRLSDGQVKLLEALIEQFKEE